MSDLLQRRLSAILTENLDPDEGMAQAQARPSPCSVPLGHGMNLLLLLPALLLMGLVFVWPMLRYGWLSFHADSVLTGLIPLPMAEPPRFACWMISASGRTRFRPPGSPGLRWPGTAARACDCPASGSTLAWSRVLGLTALGTPHHDDGPGLAMDYNTPYGPLERLSESLGLGPLNLLSTPCGHGSSP